MRRMYEYCYCAVALSPRVLIHRPTQRLVTLPLPSLPCSHAVATLNRGFVAQEADRVDLEEIIEMLELENPNPTPCEGFKSMSSPIAGRWQ